MAISLVKVISLNTPFVANVGSSTYIGNTQARGSILFSNMLGGGIRLTQTADSKISQSDVFRIKVKAGWSNRNRPSVIFHFGTADENAVMMLGVNKVEDVDKLIFYMSTYSDPFLFTCPYPSQTCLIEIDIRYDLNEGLFEVRFNDELQEDYIHTEGSMDSPHFSGDIILGTATHGAVLAWTEYSSSVIGDNWIQDGEVCTFGGRIGGFSYAINLEDDAEIVKLDFSKNRYLPTDSKELLMVTTDDSVGDIRWIDPRTGDHLTTPHVPPGIVWYPEQSRLRQKKRSRGRHE